MADYLTLCQEFRSKAGIAGTGPVAVAGQVGEYQRVVTWIQEAWTKIQLLPHDWKWMWREYTPFNTVASVSDYVLTDVEKIHKNTLTSYKVSIGVSDKSHIRYHDWDNFQSKFEASVSDDGNPSAITRMPTGNMRIYPAPDVPYTIGFEYQKTPQILAANTDVPELPVEFHMIILYRALLDHGGYEETSDVYNYAKSEYDSLLRSLQTTQKLVRADQWVVTPQ